MAVVIFGLAVGIAVCFLLLGFVRHSFSYDENVPERERERVFVLKEFWNVAALGNQWSDGSSMPAATTLPFEALGGTSSLVWPSLTNFRDAWGGTAGRIYLKLLPGADPQAVLDAVRRGLIEYKLGSLAEAYLDPDLQGSSPTHGDRRAMLGLAAVALLILLLAAVNYVNLATIRTLARQREIAMRKVLVCLIATAIGLLLAWLVLPLFSDLVQRRFDTMFGPGALAANLVFGALLGVAAGAWPTWSALRVRGIWVRRILTALQFAVAIGLTGTTLAVVRIRPARALRE